MGRPRIYASYKTAGLWRSDDSGNTWTPLTERVPFVGMHVVTVAPANPDIVWIGTAGGVFKSVDAGAHWTYTGFVGSGGFELQDEATIGRIVIHPKNPQIVYVAVQGLGVDDNETCGVFRTNDGGRSWKRILHRGPRTGAIDVVMDPRNPQVLSASMWQHIYREGPVFGNNNRDSNQTSIWKTRDGGTTWTEASRGLPPARNRGRMGIDISRSNPDVLYPLLDSFELLREATDGEVDRADTASVCFAHCRTSGYISPLRIAAVAGDRVLGSKRPATHTRPQVRHGLPRSCATEECHDRQSRPRFFRIDAGHAVDDVCTDTSLFQPVCDASGWSRCRPLHAGEYFGCHKVPHAVCTLGRSARNRCSA